VSLQIHLTVKHDKFLVQTFLLCTYVMIILEVDSQSFVIDVILLLGPRVSSVAEEAALMIVPAVYIELIRGVEALPAETALWMALETALVLRARLVVAGPLVLPQLLGSE
jgi:hypothetical protein